MTKHLNAYNGNIIVGGLFHYHKNLVQNPKRKRRLKFTIRLDDGSVFENFTNSVYIGSRCSYYYCLNTSLCVVIDTASETVNQIDR